MLAEFLEVARRIGGFRERQCVTAGIAYNLAQQFITPLCKLT